MRNEQKKKTRDNAPIVNRKTDEFPIRLHKDALFLGGIFAANGYECSRANNVVWHFGILFMYRCNLFGTD